MPKFFAAFWSALALGQIASVAIAAPASPFLGDVLSNATITSSPEVGKLLNSRALGKREVYFRCDGDAFGTLLQEAFTDANTIMLNMVDHLNLAIDMYLDDDSGELKDEKKVSTDRTFDENNAFNSYARLVTVHYGGENADINADGLKKLKATRDRAVTVQGQFANYLSGTTVTWTRGGLPWLHIFCGDNDLYSETNKNGMSYYEDTGYANSGGGVWWLSQSEGVVLGEDAVWVPKRIVCDDGSGDTTRYSVNVPVDKTVNAYTSKANFGLIAETIVFCPNKFDEWRSIESTRVASSLHYRKLHVPIGGALTTEQTNLVTGLLASDIMTEGHLGSGIRWLSQFVVGTLIHEATHAEAFTGSGNALIDVSCANLNGGVLTTSTPICQQAVAKGTQGVDLSGNAAGGEKDAEMFAKYAMAMYVNAVTWFRSYRPQERR